MRILDIFGWTALVTRWIHWITVKLPSPTFNFREYINLFLTNSIFSFSFLPSPLRHDMLGLFFHQMGENLADPIFATFRSNNGRDQDPLCWTTTEQTEPWGETKQPDVIRRGQNSPKMKISTRYQICLLVG